MANSNSPTKIVKRNENFAEWYTSVILAAKLASYASVKGCINYLPKGWAIWEHIKDAIDSAFKKTGVLNVQLPLFIKTSDFTKEKDHIAGFAPESFLVEHIGEKKVEDTLIIRPTSEVLFSQVFKDEIHSYNDLPLKYNQWCSVYRAEKTTKPFLRGSEIIWQELHAMFASEDEAVKYTLQIHELYNDFLKDVLCLPFLSGKKTEGEKFAGAVTTYTREVWSQDCQTIQTGTSHYLGTNFSKMYDVQFQNKNNKLELPYYMSAGMTTRTIGDIIMVHADDNGLVLPFKVAPTQIAILLLFCEQDKNIIKAGQDLAKKLDAFRTYIDTTNNSFGYKINEQEVSGTPFSIIIGPKDLANNSCMVYRRDLKTKSTIKLTELVETITKMHSEYDKNLYNKALEHLNSSIVEVSTFEEFVKAINDKKIVLAPWGGTVEDEAKLKEQTSGVTPRCVFKEGKINKNCFFTKKPAKQLVYFARSY